MKKTYKAENISCGNCANMIKVSLEEEFGEISVNLNTEPKEVTVEIKDESQEKAFFDEMSNLGFEIIK
jgi:copper chaperone CopZ